MTHTTKFLGHDENGLAMYEVTETYTDSDYNATPIPPREYPNRRKYTKEDVIKKAGSFLDLDGVCRFSTNGAPLAEWLEEIGFTIIDHRDTGTCGLVCTKEGIKVSTNGYTYM